MGEVNEHKTSRKKSDGGKFLSMVIWAICGLLIAILEPQINNAESAAEIIIGVWITIFAFYLALILQVIIHESGHLVCGLISGYKFNMFRIFSFALVKGTGKIRFKRFGLAGTSGQCLMLPPEEKNGKFPVVLYNLGGIIFNALSGVIFIAIYIIFDMPPVAETCMLVLGISGIGMALQNGLPLRMGIVDNDACNTVALAKNKKAARAFRVQLLIAGGNSDCVRLKDMPAEWFVVPEDEDMENGLVAACGALACNRLVDEHKFDEARDVITHMLEIESGMEPVYRGLLINDLIYIEAISYNRHDVIVNLYCEEQQAKFMKAMKRSVSVMRTEYTLALRCENNIQKAEEILKKFNKLTKNYPYLADLQSERELINIAAGRTPAEVAKTERSEL